MTLPSTSSFKYAAQLALFTGCPPPCTPASGEVFRVVHKPIVKKDFEPQGLYPKDDATPDCSDWGLSMFTTAGAVQAKFGGRNGLMKKYRKMRNDLGEYIAKGTLNNAHGNTTPPSKSKHFDLYEFTGTDLAPEFDIVGHIVILD